MYIDTPHPSCTAMWADFNLIDALCGGTVAMRAAGETYLPKRKLETDDEYKARLDLATLYPAFSETVSTMVGRVFAEPLLIDPKTPQWIQDEVFPDVDRQGVNLHVFAYQSFEQAFKYGLSHVIVDNTVAGDVNTLADQKAQGVRPYYTRVSPRQVLGWRTDGGGKLTQLRVRFSVEVAAGDYGVATQEQIRVYEVGSVKVHVKGDKGAWQLQETITVPNQKRIPIITLYTNRTGFMTGRPPLLELAHLNAKHWRMQSDNDMLVETASVPILVTIGVDSPPQGEGEEGGGITIGAKHGVNLPAGAEMRYVEHTGAAIGAGRTALDALKDEMRQAGAKLLVQAEGVKTATQAGEEAAEENSRLGGMVRQLDDTLVDLADLTAEQRNESKGGGAKAQPNLDPDDAPIESMTFLLSMRNSRVLSDETLFNEAKRRGMLEDELEWEDEKDRIDASGMPPLAAPGTKPPANDPTNKPVPVKAA